MYITYGTSMNETHTLCGQTSFLQWSRRCLQSLETCWGNMCIPNAAPERGQNLKYNISLLIFNIPAVHHSCLNNPLVDKTSWICHQKSTGQTEKCCTAWLRTWDNFPLFIYTTHPKENIGTENNLKCIVDDDERPFDFIHIQWNIQML